MTPSSVFHLIGYAYGFTAFAMIYWGFRPALLQQGRDAHLKVLLPIHFFRFFGLTAMLPGIFDLTPAGFSQNYLFQIMAGDVLVATLALIAFALFQRRSPLRIGFAWLFNVIGTLDYLNAAVRVTPSIHDANILGPFGWIILTVFLPAWLVSHLAIFAVLASRQPAPAAG